MSIFNDTSSIKNFRDERDWKQFHNPKDLSIALSIEASELLENFLWKNNDEIIDGLSSVDMENIEDEIADVYAYLLLLANELNINLSDALTRKIKKNAIKYPINLSKGKNTKYTQLKTSK